MTNDPPLGTCPVHPDKNAWRTCLRCGRFLCAICTHPTPRGSMCPECVKTLPPVAERIGGWLVLPLISLFLNPAVAVFSVYRDSDVSLEGTSSGWVAYWLWDLLPSCFAGVLSVITLPLFLMKKRVVPRLMMALYALLLVSNLVDFALEHLLPADWIAPGQNPLARTVAPMVWLLYFKFSDRVKRTFVN